MLLRIGELWSAKSWRDTKRKRKIWDLKTGQTHCLNVTQHKWSSTGDRVTPWESVCLCMWRKVPFNCVTNYTQPVLKILKMDSYIPVIYSYLLYNVLTWSILWIIFTLNYLTIHSGCFLLSYHNIFKDILTFTNLTGMWNRNFYLIPRWGKLFSFLYLSCLVSFLKNCRICCIKWQLSEWK